MKNKKFHFRGKQVLVFGLVALVLAAGYYRWTVETNQAVSIPVTSDATPVASASPAPNQGGLAQAKQDRDTKRSAALEAWQSIAENENATAEDKADAENKIKLSNENAEKEGSIETLVKAKGFDDCFAMMDETGITVIVSGPELDSSLVAQIKDIIVSQTDLPAKAIKISHQ